MSRKKSDVVRPYPPTFVSRGTLAYQLDISESKLAQLLERGLLPRAEPRIDGMERWYWPSVVAFMRGRSIDDLELDAARDDASDPYMTRLKKRGVAA